MNLAKGFRMGPWRVFPDRCCIEPSEHESFTNVSTEVRLQAHRLEPKLMSVLLMIAERQGEVVTREEILETVWPDAHVAASGLTRNVSQLRKLLGDDRKAPRFIETIPKIGYRLIIPINPLEDDSDGPAVSKSIRTDSIPSSLVAWLTGVWRWVPIVVGLLLIGVALGWLRGPTSPSGSTTESIPSLKEKPSLAVLPLVNRTGTSELEYVVDGITDDLITGLSKDGRIDIVARTSSFAFKDRSMDIREIARTLGVNHVVEGSVQRTGDQVQITVHLVDGKKGFQQWSKSFLGRFDQLIGLQVEIDQNLRGQLTGEPIDTTVQTELPTDSQAHDYYLLGQYWCHKGSVRNFPKAIEYFEAATRQDPTYARAWSAMGRTWMLLGLTGSSPSSKFLPRAVVAAERAVALDATDDEAQATLGMIALFRDLDWRKAEAHIQQAITINGKNPLNRLWYAQFLAALGRYDEAVREIQVALDLDPLGYYLMAMGADIHIKAGQFDRAEALLEMALSLKANFLPAQVIHGYLAGSRGSWDQALARFQTVDPEASFLIADLALAYAHQRQFSKARDLLERLPGGGQNYRRALVWLAMDETDKALGALESAWQQREADFLLVICDAVELDPIRDHPRFQAIASQVNFPIRDVNR